MIGVPDDEGGDTVPQAHVVLKNAEECMDPLLVFDKLADIKEFFDGIKIRPETFAFFNPLKLSLHYRSSCIIQETSWRDFLQQGTSSGENGESPKIRIAKKVSSHSQLIEDRLSMNDQ